MQGKLSYAAVLHDGCRFKANNIEIILEPTEIDEAKKEHVSGKGEDRSIKTETKKLDKLSDELHFRKDKNFSGKNDIPMNVKGRTEEGQEGLNFLANWIEVVLDRLEISVEDVFLVIRDSKVSNTSFTLHLSEATFFNTNPRLLDSRLVQHSPLLAGSIISANTHLAKLMQLLEVSCADFVLFL